MASARDPVEVADRARKLARSIDNGTVSPAPSPASTAQDVYAFVEAHERTETDDFDWLIPGVLERGDRMIVTGREGVGKSTLLQQMALQGAAGIHPFTLEHIPSLTTVLVDLENSPNEVARRLKGLIAVAGPQRQRLFVETFSGLELDAEADEDRKRLRDLVDTIKPDLLIVTPLYKTIGGDLDKERDCRAVIAALDRLRTRGNFAFLTEAHVPHDARSSLRPIGSTVWRRWPEIGLGLHDSGKVEQWRRSRHPTPKIPEALRRDGRWPFEAVTDTADKHWVDIKSYCSGLDSNPSYQEIADALGVSKTTTHRAIQRHLDEWDAMWSDTEGGRS